MPNETVADVMSRSLVTVEPECPIPQLEKVLTQSDIGAVPVLAQGNIIGIVTTSDVVRQICAERSVAEVMSVADVDLSGFDANVSDAAKFTEIAERLGCRIDHLTATDMMSDKVYSIAPQAPLADAARMMMENRFHHVLVVDNGAPVGLISSYDIVRHVAGQNLT